MHNSERKKKQILWKKAKNTTIDKKQKITRQNLIFRPSVATITEDVTKRQKNLLHV